MILTVCRWRWPLVSCITVALMSTPCTWIVRVTGRITKAMRWPWVICLKPTGKIHTPIRWGVFFPISVQMLLIFFFWSRNVSAPILVSRWSSFLHVSEQSPTLHQQYSSDHLAEPRLREESSTHTWCFATVGHLQVRVMKMRGTLNVETFVAD